MLPLLAALVASATGCNKKDDDEDDPAYIEPSSLAVNGFYLKADKNVLRGLDSVFFSIDLQRAVIYNADSLPKGTRITDLIPVISYSQYINSATITMEGGSKRSGESDYLHSPNDSIDFTGSVRLTIGSSNGGTRVYTLKVNVHEQEPDSLCWGETALSALPSRMADPQEQKTVMYGGKVCCMIKESDGSHTLAVTANPAEAPWEKREIGFAGFQPRLSTLTATDEALCVLSADGRLHTSADGVTWTEAGVSWSNILGAYGQTLLGLRADGDRMMLTSWPGGAESVMPDGFPTDEYTNMYVYESQWMAAPIGIIAGGTDSRGNLLSSVWGYDGMRWAKLSDDAMPALRGATLVPYASYIEGKTVWEYKEYPTLILMGGVGADGTFSRDTYISYNNGVAWAKAPELMRLPEYMPGLWRADNVVAGSRKDASLQDYWRKMPGRRMPSWYRVAAETDGYDVSWVCPYIYIFGGRDASGLLNNSIWRGVINRLAFTPIL